MHQVIHVQRVGILRKAKEITYQDNDYYKCFFQLVL